MEEVARGDRHSAKIKENRSGILRGVDAKRRAGVINPDQEAAIVNIVEHAESRDFWPLIYVIPYAGVVHVMREPPPDDKAHPLSAEFIIDALPRQMFDVIRFSSP